MSHFAFLTSEEHAALNRPIWSALTSRHQKFALGGPLAMKYPPDIANFAATRADSPEELEALSNLLTAESPLALFTTDTPPSMLGVKMEYFGAVLQMVAPKGGSISKRRRVSRTLTDFDVSDMLKLTAMAKPGPFGPRTYLLGHYRGITVDGQLVAMAGERMGLNGFVEISAVSVHPDHRGNGYAKILVTELMDDAFRRGVTPFLHVFSDNQSAIALYRKLGLEVRRDLVVSRAQLDHPPLDG